MKERIRIRFSASFDSSSLEFAQFSADFRPNITAAQWRELRGILEQIFILSDLADSPDIRARRIAEPLFLRKESRRHYLHTETIKHLERIGDMGELLEVGYRASQQPITLERLCEGIERMKLKTEELRKKAKAKRDKRVAARANAVSL